MATREGVCQAVFLKNMDIEMDILEVEERSFQLIDKLKDKGAPIFESPRSTRVHAVADAIDLMLLRGMIKSTGDRFKASSERQNLRGMRSLFRFNIRCWTFPAMAGLDVHFFLDTG